MSTLFEAEVRKLCGDGDGTARGTIHAAWRQARPHEDTDAAIAQLMRLYPAELVQAQVDDPRTKLGQLMYPLLVEAWLPQSGELLQLGLDLAVCEGWEQQLQLMKRLRNEAEFASARFEVGLWAGALRTGLTANYVIATQAQDCDIELQDGEQHIRVEAKMCLASDRSRGASRIWAAVDRATRMCAEHLSSVGGMDLGIHLEQPLVALCSQGGPEFDQRLAALAAALEAWLEVCVRPLALDAVTSDVEHVGRVRFRRGCGHNGVAIEIDDIGEEPVKEAVRALRLAADARKQLDNGTTALRVAAVSTGTLDCPAAYAAQIGGRTVREQPGRFAGIDWIVFVNAHTQLGDWRTSAVPLAVAASARSPGDARWLKAMTAWRRSC